jgi:hypothetical protein
MEHGNRPPDVPLHTLIPLADFKAILDLDDRENTLSRYCLITAAYTIEQHCKQRLLRRENTDCLTCTGLMIFSLIGIYLGPRRATFLAKHAHWFACKFGRGVYL